MKEWRGDGRREWWVDGTDGRRAYSIHAVTQLTSLSRPMRNFFFIFFFLNLTSNRLDDVCLPSEKWQLHCVVHSTPVCVRRETIQNDTIRDAILTCARKPTWVSLIYCTEATTKKYKTENLKSKERAREILFTKARVRFEPERTGTPFLFFFDHRNAVPVLFGI